MARRSSALLFLLLVRCSDGKTPVPTPPTGDSGPDVLQPTYTIEQLKDPETCNQCHTKHYREWSGSMHAYAADDPLFLAMNERGQKEANIGNFCVQCHAPMAMPADPNQIVTSRDVMALPKEKRGVTCYFCHNVDAVTDTHNNPLHLANDNVMRARFDDAVPNEAHRSEYSNLVDGTQLPSARTCGSCHDLVNGHGAHVERTFAEWQESVFSTPVRGLTCAQCHLKTTPRDELIADGPSVKGVRVRPRHDHRMAGVDRALTPFPGTLDQEEALKEELNFPPALQTGLCVAYFGSQSQIIVIIDNIQAGHKWPSGAAQDRQLWTEVTAYSGGNVIYQSGAVPPGTDPTDVADPDIWLMRDCMFDQQGKQTHLFWEAMTSDSNVLPAPVTLDPMNLKFYESHKTRAFPAQSKLSVIPDKVTLKIWVQAFPYAVFDEFMPEMKALGHNEAEIASMRAKIVPMQVTANTDTEAEPSALEWTEAAAKATLGGILPTTTDVLKDIPKGISAFCVTKTTMQLGVDTRKADRHMICKP